MDLRPYRKRSDQDTISPMERNIEASTSVVVPLARACAVLRDDPGALLTDATTAQQRRQRRFPVALEAPVGSGASLSHQVEIEIGPPKAADDETTVRLAWHPTAHHRLVPSFDGVLALRHGGGSVTELTVRGSYRVPLGAAGRFGDAVIGRRIARHTVDHLLETLARRLQAESNRRRDTDPSRPAPRGPDLRDLPTGAPASSPDAAQRRRG